MSNTSFSEKIKNEIIEYNWTQKQWHILFYSFLKTNGTFKSGKYIVTSTQLNLEEKFNELFREFCGLEIRPRKLVKMIKYEIEDVNFLNSFSTEIETLVMKNSEEHKAYIAGMFIGKGTISNPNTRFYHFEIRVRDLKHSSDIQKSFSKLGIKTKITKKHNWVYIYVKRSDNIAKIISALNASQSLMVFEDSRIERDFIASFKRMKSIEKHNFKKLKNVSDEQVRCINKILEFNLIIFLTKEQIILMDLRIEKPNYSLSELQMEYNFRNKSNVSKSTINNWLKIIVKTSKKGELDNA